MIRLVLFLHTLILLACTERSENTSAHIITPEDSLFTSKNWIGCIRSGMSKEELVACLEESPAVSDSGIVLSYEKLKLNGVKVDLRCSFMHGKLVNCKVTFRDKRIRLKHLTVALNRIYGPFVPDQDLLVWEVQKDELNEQEIVLDPESPYVLEFYDYGL